MRKTDSRPSTPNPQQPADQQVNALDPRQIPVWHEATSQVQQQQALALDRLSLSAVRQRFANPLPWQPEQRSELLPWQQPPRDAAVLLGLQPLQQAPDQLRVLLTQRTEHLKSHAGQIAFPGGKIDPDDADAVAAALREAEEEVGLPVEGVQVLGKLPSYMTGTGYRVTPVVGILSPDVNLLPNPNEVAEVFTVPLPFLMDPRHHRKHQWQPAPDHRREWFSMPYQEADTGIERYIWGVTAGILRDFYRFLAA